MNQIQIKVEGSLAFTLSKMIREEKVKFTLQLGEEEVEVHLGPQREVQPVVLESNDEQLLRMAYAATVAAKGAEPVQLADFATTMNKLGVVDYGKYKQVGLLALLRLLPDLFQVTNDPANPLNHFVVLNTRRIGKIKYVKEGQNYAFLVVGGRDAFIHKSAFEDADWPPAEGKEFSVVLRQSSKGFEAREARPVI